MKNKMWHVLLLVFIAGTAHAQIDNLTNLSPEWTRVGTRNAAFDGSDVMMYNPGGAARLNPGWHIAIGNQSTFRTPRHEYAVPDLGAGPANYAFEQDGNDLFMPNLNVAWVKNNWAFCGGLNVVAGGGEANFPSGSLNTEFLSLVYIDAFMGAYTASINQHLNASSYSLAATVGASYKLNDLFSFGVMVRNVMGTNTSEAGFTLTNSPVMFPDTTFVYRSEATASGFGVVLGMHCMPTQELSLSARYETQVTMDYKTKELENNMFTPADGEKNRRDLPAVLGFGAAWNITEKTKLMFDLNYYFQTQANWDSTQVMTETMKTSDLAGDATCYGLGLEYTINSKFLWSLGGNYTHFDFKNQSGYFGNFGAYETAPGDNVALCTGIAYNPMTTLRINVGFTQAMYTKETIKSVNYASAGIDVDVHTRNTISMIGIGLNYSF